MERERGRERERNREILPGHVLSCRKCFPTLLVGIFPALPHTSSSLCYSPLVPWFPDSDSLVQLHRTRKLILSNCLLSEFRHPSQPYPKLGLSQTWVTCLDWGNGVYCTEEDILYNYCTTRAGSSWLVGKMKDNIQKIGIIKHITQQLHVNGLEQAGTSKPSDL